MTDNKLELLKNTLQLDKFEAFNQSEKSSEHGLPDLRNSSEELMTTISHKNPMPLPDTDFYLNMMLTDKYPRTKLSRNEIRRKYGTKLQPEIRFHIENIAKTNPDCVILDLGCGSGGNRKYMESLGLHNIISVDYSAAEADFLVDAHDLPFKDSSFDLILTTQTIEHFQNPFRALQEISRILGPEGELIASASFWESWHDNSCFHFTPHGFYILCKQANMKLDDMWSGWGGLASTMSHVLGPNFRRLAYFLQSMVDKVIRLVWGREKLERLRLRTSGSFGVLASKIVDGDN